MFGSIGNGICSLLIKFIASDLMLPCFTHWYIAGWWYTYLSEKYAFVNDDEIPNWMESQKNHVPNHQSNKINWPKFQGISPENIVLRSDMVRLRSSISGSWNLPSGFYLTSHSELENPNHKWRFSSLGKSSISVGHHWKPWRTVSHNQRLFSSPDL